MRKLFLSFAVFFYISTSISADPPKVMRSKAAGIPNEYIVALSVDTPRSSVEGIARSIASAYRLEIVWLWPDTLRGFMCRAENTDIDKMSTDPRVRYVEQNAFYTPDDARGGVSATQYTSFGGEYQWHLDRLDELYRTPQDTDGTYNMCTEARNVTAYVVDQSIWRNHEQFTETGVSRVTAQWDFTNDRVDRSAQYDADVSNGCTAQGFEDSLEYHGTMVASVLGGASIGAAKPNIVGLKVQQCKSPLITAADLQHAIAWLNSNATRPSVVNISNFLPPWDAQFKRTATPW